MAGTSGRWAAEQAEVSEGDETAIREGYDFVQLRNGPFPLDLIYAPLGIFQLIGGRPAGHAHRHDVSPCPPAPAASRTLRMTTANRRTSGIVAAFSTTYSTGCLPAAQQDDEPLAQERNLPRQVDQVGGGEQTPAELHQRIHEARPELVGGDVVVGLPEVAEGLEGYRPDSC